MGLLSLSLPNMISIRFVDYAFQDATELRDRALFEVIKFVTDAPPGTFNGQASLVFNRATWEQMPIQTRTAWYAATAKGMATLANIVAIDRTTELEEGVPRGLFDRLEPSKVLVDAMSQFRASQTPTLVAKATDRGIDDVQAIAD